LLSLSLSLLTQQIREELEQRQTVSDICIWNKKRGMKKMINQLIFYNIRQ
jgi:hypothetical protein